MGNTQNYTPATTATGTLYYYVVITNTIFNNGDGGTKTASVTSSVAAIIVNVIKLATPTLGIVTATSSSAIVVNWTGVANTSGYTVQYAKDSSFTTGVGTQNFAAGAVSGSLTGLTANTTYYVRIMATGTGNYSDSNYSTAKNAATLPIVTNPTVQTIIRDTNTAKDGTYEEAIASRITTLNEWSHFSMEAWATTGEHAAIVSFSMMTFLYNPALFAVHQVIFVAGFSGTSNTSVAGRVTFSASSATPQTGRVLLARIELKPAATPYKWTTSSPISSNLGFTASTISIQSQPVSGGSVTTSTPSIVVQNLIVSPVPYNLAEPKNNAIDLQDFSVFIKQFGKTQTSASADFNGDGKVDLKDFSLFIKAFGKSRTTGLRNTLAPAGAAMSDLAAVLSTPIDSLERAADVAQHT